MLTCIACSKQLNTGSLREPEEDETAATPSKKQAIKALTAQVVFFFSMNLKKLLLSAKACIFSCGFDVLFFSDQGYGS